MWITARDLMNQDRTGLELGPDEPGLLDPWVQCNYRDVIQVKGKGPMDTFYLELTEDLQLVEHRLQRRQSDCSV